MHFISLNIAMLLSLWLTAQHFRITVRLDSGDLFNPLITLVAMLSLRTIVVSYEKRKPKEVSLRRASCE